MSFILSSAAIKSWKHLCWEFLHPDPVKGYLLTPQPSKRGETLFFWEVLVLLTSLFHYYKSKCKNCSWFYVTIPKDVYQFNWLVEAVVLVSSFKACLCPVAMLWWSWRSWRNAGLGRGSVVFWRQSCMLYCQHCV